ncbi:hypothetical protein V6N11_051454 [Hibiscus sabdariffa]|uniref:Uncharacterized protein n=1 Tax=Hibiscus sabdariffa TaxID=183260 RepID=A0ABR2U7W0_9ROSI
MHRKLKELDRGSCKAGCKSPQVTFYTDDCSTVTSILPSLVLDTGTDLVIVLIVEVVVIEGSDLATDGLVIKGSTTEIINTHGSRRKVRLLSDVIQSVVVGRESSICEVFI